MPLRSLRAFVLALLVAALPLVARAQDEPAPGWLESQLRENADGDYWRLMIAPYTWHRSENKEGDHEYVYLFGIERQFASGWLLGAAYFSNSFGQSSGYVYGGEKVFGWSPWPDRLYFEWTAGLIWGYTDPYDHKIPFNVGGLAPGLVIGLGWQFTRNLSAQVNLLGTAALMFQLNWDFR